MELRFPWTVEPLPVDTPAPLPVDTPAPVLEISPPPKPRGRRPAASQTRRERGGWLYHHLTISGPAEPVAAFAEAARGSGVIPWQLDFALIEEDLFNLAASQPAERRRLTIRGCRILARQFRERVEMRQAKALALVGRSRACPFDLQMLLPVPAGILALGPTHPAALAWLSEHWGVSDRLRQVVERQVAPPQRPTEQRLPKGHAVIGYGFFTPRDTPYAAVTRLGQCRPALRFSLQPRPAD
jgi:hypothetical protein